MAARGEPQVDVEVSTLVVPAWRLRWQAPELALVLGERALALAATRHDEADRLKAEALVVFASNRIGRGVRIADRALDALKAAESAAEHQTAWLLRIELAGCARSVGAPLTGFAAVSPVLEAQGVPYALRAAALVEASECIVTVGRGDEPAHALEEADRLYAADTVLDPNTRLLLRGLLRAVSAAQFRRWGDIPAAISAAREGLNLLDQLSDPSADSGQARGRLTLELVCALMDANKLADASEAGTPLLDRPVRAPSASTAGWLRLALATRVHLPAGRVAQARDMLRDAADSAERHQLDTLLAESLLALAHVHEVSGELTDALTNLRVAHAAERRRARAVYAVRARLAAEFSGVHRQPSSLHQQLAGLLRSDGGPPRPTADTTTLTPELKQQLRQWRPVQVRKGDGLKVKRVRRAAEDMTVEGLSAARAHAADRWRLVQPFGEPGTKPQDPVDPTPPPPAPQSDRTVPAAGLIASAGAMISGRRRAAREAASDPTDPPATHDPALPPTYLEAQSTLASDHPSADLRPPLEPAHETQPPPGAFTFEPPSAGTTSQSPTDSVMDMLKAAGLRQGGRRRAPDPSDADPSNADPSNAGPTDARPLDLSAPGAGPFDANPSGMSSAGLDLSGLSPFGADPSGADPAGARRSTANPSDAWLLDAGPSGADPAGSDLPDADLPAGRQGPGPSGLSASGVDSSGPARFDTSRSDAWLLGTGLSGADPTGSDLPAARPWLGPTGASASGEDQSNPGQFDPGQFDTSRSDAGQPDAWLLGADLPGVNPSATGLPDAGAFDAARPGPAPSAEPFATDPADSFHHDSAASRPFRGDPADTASAFTEPTTAKPAERGTADQQWRVEAPAHLRSPEPPAAESVLDFFAPPASASPAAGPDSLPPRSTRSSLSAAFGHAPAEPHYDLPFAEPAGPAQVGPPSSPGFGPQYGAPEVQSNYSAADPDLPAIGSWSGAESQADVPPVGEPTGPSHKDTQPERVDEPVFGYPTDVESPTNLAAAFRHDPAEARPAFGLETDEARPAGLAAAFGRGRSAEAFRVPEPEPERLPELPEPEPAPMPPLPDPVPDVPVPDEVPAPPEPDLLSDSFLSSADVEDEPRPDQRQQPEPPPQQRVDLQQLDPETTIPPSKRRKPSDQSLADLLAEALVAYETGRAQAEDPETTGPIKPVEPDPEKTGPIRPLNIGWTLPGT